eukprot:COSAG01_NODE_30_length_36127_cov_41.433234_15_plen_72_part_00
MLHAKVRQRLRRRAYWRSEAWGVPINQVGHHRTARQPARQPASQWPLRAADFADTARVPFSRSLCLVIERI